MRTPAESLPLDVEEELCDLTVSHTLPPSVARDFFLEDRRGDESLLDRPVSRDAPGRFG